MSLEIVATSSAPRPLGPYSQAVRAGSLLFVAGSFSQSGPQLALVWAEQFCPEVYGSN